jgi:hypothetical protein
LQTKKSLLKRIFVILFAFLFLTPTWAQKKKILNEPTHDERAVHFGFCLGFNVATYIVKQNYEAYLRDSLFADVSNPGPGIQIQAIANFRLGEYLDLRILPGVSLGQRQLNFFKNGTIYNKKHKLEYNYIEFPVLLKYKGKRINNFRPYVIGGPNLRYNLAKTYSEDNEVFLDFKKFDCFGEIGPGADFYMPYFKLSIELKYSYGFRNLLLRRTSNQPIYQNAIESIHSSMWLLSFHFE